MLEIILPPVFFAVCAGVTALPSTTVMLGAMALASLMFWRVERRRIAEKTRRTVMASVMDSQNNLMNNMVYFRMKAESAGGLPADELAEIDKAVMTARDRLVEIAQADLDTARDLGGIRVLAPLRRATAS